MLQVLWDPLSQLEALIERLETRIDQLTVPFEPVLATLCEIPGIEKATAQVILAELGPDMPPFPSAAHLASWAGMGPGKNESAGKRHSGKTTKGSRWLRAALVQAAWAASHAKASDFHAPYHRLARRRGKKRALIAGGHAILVMIYHLIKTQTPYQDLGTDYFDQGQAAQLTRYDVKRLEHMGFQGSLQAKQQVA